MITLALDAATYSGSVAVLDGGRVLSEASIAMKGADRERLMPAVADALIAARVPVERIGRVVCGDGPGSFTSLRIAGGIAKGIATGLGCPLYVVPSLGLIVAAASLARGLHAAVLDALRGEVYIGLYEVDAGGDVREVDSARVIAADAATLYAESVCATLVGPAHGGQAPHARGIRAFEHLLETRGPVDLASWEPSYGRLAEAQVRWEATHGRRLDEA